MILSESYRAVAAALEDRLAEVLTPSGQVAHAPVLDAMAAATLGGGKRLRGVLAVLSGDVCGVGRAQSLTLAAGIECLHAYSLVHDDLPAMDDADTRRGRPSIHKAFDEATAILAGDGLQALAFELAGQAGMGPAGVVAFAQAVGRHGMVGGQMQDMLAEAGTLERTEGNLRALHAGKTGALIQFSAQAGTYLAEPSGHVEAYRQALGTYGAALGLAFQIWDDVLDVIGDASLTGKPTGHDDQKMTFVSLMGLKAAKTAAAAQIAEAKAALPPDTLAKQFVEIADFCIQRSA